MSKNSASQTDLVINFIRKHGSITPKQALAQLGVFRLAARIFDLRNDGHLILTHKHEIHTRKGLSIVAKYTIKKQ